ncbi:hypothetical protein ABZT28_33245 [Streptomyces sp. NPDC005388]|uniref:hypothetical protein n=1 Tax=Streptomyces sp. NPDC005388 TaxID=3156717 RepID=UPI0033BE9AC5
MKQILHHIIRTLQEQITPWRTRIFLIVLAVTISGALLLAGIITAEAGSYIIGVTALLTASVQTRPRCRHTPPEGPPTPEL